MKLSETESQLALVVPLALVFIPRIGQRTSLLMRIAIFLREHDRNFAKVCGQQPFRFFTKAAAAIAVVCSSGFASSQIVSLQAPEFLACRDRPASSSSPERCLRGPAALVDSSKLSPKVVERMMLVHSNSTEEEVKTIFGVVPRLVKPSAEASIDGKQYISQSMSWWVLQDKSLSDEQLAEGGTIEVQFVNGRAVQVWWHRLDGFLNIELGRSACVYACPTVKTQGSK